MDKLVHAFNDGIKQSRQRFKRYDQSAVNHCWHAATRRLACHRRGFSMDGDDGGIAQLAEPENNSQTRHLWPTTHTALVF